MRFLRKYNVVDQFLETPIEELAIDILRLMKDSRGSAFPPVALINSICSLYPSDRESEVDEMMKECLRWLEEEKLIEKMDFMTFDRKAVQDLVITLKGWSIKQFETSDEYFIQAHHISGLTMALERELDDIQRSCHTEDFSDELNKWKSKTESLIEEHTGRRDLTELLEEMKVHSESEYFELVEDWRKLRDLLHQITAAVSYIAPPIAVSKNLSPADFAERVKKLHLKWDGFTYQGSRISEETILWKALRARPGVLVP